MSKLRSLPYAVLTIGLLAAGSASAQSMWSIDQREASQQQRINEGRRDGSLTRSEASRLQQGDNRIDRYEARARSDGVVTSSERQRLDGMLDRQGRAIHRQRTDGQQADGNDRGKHKGWDNNRGNHYGRDGNPGNHYGRDGNPGNHYGWDNNRGNHNGWSNNDRTHGGVNRPEHSTHTGWNGSTRAHPQPAVNTTSNGGRNNRR